MIQEDERGALSLNSFYILEILAQNDEVLTMIALWESVKNDDFDVSLTLTPSTVPCYLSLKTKQNKNLLLK